MSFLCRLGRHRPRGIPRWNDGYYFAICERCGSDLVRTAYQSWHVPRGYRVVWSDRPPASRPEVALMPEEKRAPAHSGLPEVRSEPGHGPEGAAPTRLPEPVQGPFPGPEAPSPSTEPPAEVPAAPAPAAGPDERHSLDPPAPAPAPAPAAGSRGGRLPIEDVLAQLNAEDAAGRTREPAPPPTEVPAARRRSSWDFMDDEASKEGAASGLASVARPPVRSPEPASTPDADPVRGEAGAPPPGGRGDGPWRRFRSAMRDFWSGPGEPRPVLVVAVAMVVAVLAALALALPSAPSPSGGPSESSRPPGDGQARADETSDPFAADAGPSGPEAEAARRREAENAAAEYPEGRGYVVASLLSCRAAPALQAPRVRNLARGQEVLVLGYDGEWASLLYRDGQCWAQAQYISPAAPL